MRKQRYLRFNGLDIEDIKLHFCPFVKHFFSSMADMHQKEITGRFFGVLAV